MGGGAGGRRAGGRAYFGHMENEFVCVDLEKGTNVWSYRDRAFPYYSSPAVTSNRVVFGGRDKRLHCVNRADGKPVWTFPTRGKVDSSPVICGDKVVVGSDDGRLYVVSLDKGKELWSYEIGRPIGSSPAVTDGKVVIGSDDGNVYCFGAREQGKIKEVKWVKGRHECAYCSRTNQSAAAPKGDDGGQLLCLELSALFILEAGIGRRASQRAGSGASGGHAPRDLRAYSVLPQALPFLLF